MKLDKEEACYKLSTMDVVKYSKAKESSLNEFRIKALINLEAVDRLLRESDRILPFKK
jgi:hypothetical protein